MKIIYLTIFLFLGGIEKNEEDYYGSYKSSLDDQISFTFDNNGISDLIFDGQAISGVISYDLNGYYGNTLFLTIGASHGSKMISIKLLIENVDSEFITSSGIAVIYGQEESEILDKFSFELILNRM